MRRSVRCRTARENADNTDRLANVPLDPPLHETFAFIHRRNARPSPATRALITLAEHHLAKLATEAC